MLTNVLRHGPLLAAAASLLVSPGMMVALALIVERRAWLLVEQYTAFVFGDVALAGAVAAGAASWSRTPASVRVLIDNWQWTVLAAGLIAGLLQWRLEFNQGSYSKGQSLSPTKIWHQVVIIPVLATWVLSAIVAAVGSGDVVGSLIALGCVLLWGVLIVYDFSHPKPAHVDFDWRSGARHGQPRAPR